MNAPVHLRTAKPVIDRTRTHAHPDWTDVYTCDHAKGIVYKQKDNHQILVTPWQVLTILS